MANRTKRQPKIRAAGEHPCDTDYRAEYAREAGKLCFLGASDKELAEFFGVVESTINKWKVDHPEFSESIKRGKLKADARVAEHILKNAAAYERNAVEIVADAKAGTEHVTPYIEQFAPDMVAAAFWLKNRRPDLWCGKQEHEHSCPKGGPIDSKNTTTL